MADVNIAQEVQVNSFPALTTPTNGATVVGNVSTAIIAANASRRYACIVNDSDEEVYLALGAAAAMNQGARLNRRGGAWYCFGASLYTGAVNGICASGGKTVTRIEIT